MNKEYDVFSFSGKSINCYGLEVVKKATENRGIVYHEYEKGSCRDVLVSVYWPGQIYDFVRWRYHSDMKTRKILVGGNTPTCNPAPFLGFGANVFLGDGENWDGNIANGEYIIGENNELQKKKSVSETINPIPFADIQSNKRFFCEMSRGCKNKCLFCQYGWLKPYRESDVSDIIAVLKRSDTKSIRMFAADRFQHSKYIKIRKTMDALGKCDTGSDVSLKFVLKNKEYLKFTHKVRVGIEGMSYRLRCLVGKKYTDDDIVNFCVDVVNAGIKCLDFYMIYGLPTENKEDVDQFSLLLKKLDSALPANYVVAIHWNAFTPSAQSPFQWEESAYHYDTEHLNNKILTNRTTNSNIRLMHKPKLTSRKTILQRMLAIRCSEKTKNIIYGVSQKMSLFDKPQSILNAYKDTDGVDLLGKWPDDKDFPWDRHVVYNKSGMQKLKNQNILKHGG